MEIGIAWEHRGTVPPPNRGKYTTEVPWEHRSTLPPSPTEKGIPRGHRNTMPPHKKGRTPGKPENDALSHLEKRIPWRYRGDIEIRQPLQINKRVPRRNRSIMPPPNGKMDTVCVHFFFPFILDIKFVGRTSWAHTGGRSHRISHPPSFCGACLKFSREKDSAIIFPRQPQSRILCTNDFLIVLHPLGIFSFSF